MPFHIKFPILGPCFSLLPSYVVGTISLDAFFVEVAASLDWNENIWDDSISDECES